MAENDQGIPLAELEEAPPLAVEDKKVEKEVNAEVQVVADEQEEETPISLAKVYGSKASMWMVIAILVNFAMLLYSQIGASAQIKFSLQEDEEIILNIEGGCSLDDTDIINADAEIRDTLNVFGFQLGIDCTIAGEFELVQCFQDTLQVNTGLSSDCVACIAQFTQCAQNNCLADCRINGDNFDQDNCEVCIDEQCEFELETCSGFQFFADAEEEACLSDVDTALQSGNDIFDNLPIILAELEVGCESSGSSCVRQDLVDDFGFSDDCLSCLDTHAECIIDECESSCTGNNTGLATCEACVEASICGLAFNECSGTSRYTVARVLSEVVEEPMGRQLQQDVSFDEDSCLDKDGVPLFDRLELTFIDSIVRALDGGSIGLALLLGIFSGVWPHAKNLIMLYAWFHPMKKRRRTKILKIFSTLLSWSLVDVFAVVLIANGSLIQKQLLSGIAFLLFIEPRTGVYFFAITALWAIAQAQVIRYFDAEHNNSDSKKSMLSPTVKELNSFRKKKALLAFLGALTVFVTFIAAELPNLEMELTGEITNGRGLNSYSYNVFELGYELFSDCSIFNEHGSVPGAYFLGILFIGLVFVIPVIASMLLVFVACKLNLGQPMTPRAKRKISKAFFFGNFAALDVWLVTLFVFSNQFAGLIRGSVGEDNNCGLSDEQVEDGEICVGLEGQVGLGGFVMIGAVVLFWVCQCLAVSLVASAKKYAN